jgi:hypothetical protein
LCRGRFARNLPGMSDMPSSRQQGESLSTGLALTSLILGIAALCVPLLGIVALILGVMALNQAKREPERYGGSGMAIAGISIGAVGTIVSCLALMVGIFLPALGQARQAARQLKSATQMRNIGQALILYAQDNKDWYPEAGADWQARISKYGVAPEVYQAPEDEPGTVSYYYVPGYKSEFKQDRVILVERPGIRRKGGNVFFDDGHVEFLETAEYTRLLDSLTTPDGKPFRPWGGQ